MKWIITVDHINTHPSTSRVGHHSSIRSSRDTYRAAPAEAKPVILTELCKDFEHEFRLLDGDANVYYEGRCKGLDDADGDAAFAPMDWAVGDGVVGMQYRKTGETKWVDL